MIEPIEIGVYRDFVRRSLAEDLGWGDATVQAIIPPDATAEGVLMARAPAVLAGVDIALEAFRQLDPASCARPVTRSRSSAGWRRRC